MTTLAPPQLVYLANAWEDIYPSAVISGIVGDLAHRLRGGYHISIEDQPSDNYSVKRVDDKAPPGDWPRNMASAVDMTLNLTDMKKAHGRLRAAFQNRNNDPRMKYINAWNGWDGNDSAGRYDVVTGSISTATDDHKWHIHLEIRRRYVGSRKAMDAILSILRGETVAQYLGEDDMNKAEFLAFLESTEGRTALARAVWGTDNVVRAPGNPEPGKNPDGSTINTHWGADSYLQQIYNAAVSARTYSAEGRTTASQILDSVKSQAGVDVDEVALGAAIANNAQFVGALAQAIADKVQGGQTVQDAVKSALNDARIVVN